MKTSNFDHSIKALAIFTLISLMLTVASCTGKTDRAENLILNGAGATFPYPLYSKWTSQYNELTGVKVIYQSIGSGGGIAQIRAGTVDFGATDAPLDKEELDRLQLIQFPMVMGGVVPVVHVKGIGPGKLRLTGPVIAEIYLGAITRWNDPAIKELNPGITLPDEDITTVHRADGSGTTWIFSNYLTKVSPAWAREMGNAKVLAWPVGAGGKGNEGVSAYVQRIEGSMGYVEFAYAMQSGLSYALLKNHAGNFVAPSPGSFFAAASMADWENAPGYRVVLTEQPAEESWPITGASFILLRKEQRNSGKTRALLKFLDWCYRYGEKSASGLEYVPLPQHVVDGIESYWSRTLAAGGKSLWPPRGEKGDKE